MTHHRHVADTPMLLDPGMDLTLRPMRYPHFFDRFKDAIQNTWTVEEVDLHSDLADLATLTRPSGTWSAGWSRSSPPATRSSPTTWCSTSTSTSTRPEGRLYLSRQLFEEAVHVQFYLNLLDTYVPDEQERNEAFAAVENIPSIRPRPSSASGGSTRSSSCGAARPATTGGRSCST